MGTANAYDYEKKPRTGNSRVREEKAYELLKKFGIRFKPQGIHSVDYVYNLTFYPLERL